MTDNTTLPADWAIERALAEYGSTAAPLASVKEDPILHHIALTLARYIEKHEQPPVDPWLLQARELAAGVACDLGEIEFCDTYRAGGYDDSPAPQAIAAALRAAYEKGKAE